jgi:hypothetical protein
MSSPLTVEAIDHIVINVRDVEVAAAGTGRSSA